MSKLLVVATASTLILAALIGPPAGAGEAPLRLAMMDDMMGMGSMGQGGMQQQSQPGQMSGGMTMDNMTGMQQPGQMGGTQPQGSMGQGGMQQGQPGQMGGSMMNDNMTGMQQPGQAGQMGSMGMMMDNMMRMRQGQMGSMGMTPGMAPTGVDLTNRIEGRIAFLKAELGINDAQVAAWNRFAEALRGSRRHLLEARHILSAGMPAGGDASARLEQYERHVAARLEAIKEARASFAQLYAVLDDQQKGTADELLVPFIATF